MAQLGDRARRGTSAQRRATAALCVLAALRMLVVVAPAPMYGYANNYDFVRVSGWFDLWALAPPGAERFDPRAQHPRAPLRCYRVDSSIETHIRYPTTELGFVWLALRVNDAWRAVTGPRECHLDLRLLGLLRTAILLVAGLVVTRAFFRRAPRAGVASAAILAGVLADPAVTLLLNTLYSEFSTVLFTYLACAQIVYVLAFGRLTIGSGMLLGATLLALSGTKTQYAGLSLVLFGLLAGGTLLQRERGRGSYAALVITGLAAVTGLLAQQQALRDDGYMSVMRMAAATDTFFGAIVPLHADPDRALALLGLPASCRPHVGKTWYDEGMQPAPCPEVAGVSRLRVLRLLADDPIIGARLAARSLPLLQPLIVRYYGQVEGEDLAQADAHGPRGIGVSKVVEALPAALYALLVLLTLVAAAVAAALIVLAGPGGTGEEALLPLVVAIAGAVEVYAFASSLFGAGFIDLGRHSLTGQLAFLVLVPAGALLLVRTGRRIVADPPARRTR